MANLIEQLLNALVLAGLLFLVSAGLSLVFDDQAPYAVYLPLGDEVVVTAHMQSEIGVASAPAANASLPARLIEPSAMKRFARGTGLN